MLKVRKDKLIKIVELCVDEVELDLKSRKLTILFNPKCIWLILGGLNAEEA